MSAPNPPSEHAFESKPHRTLLRLTIPVLFSLVAEPLTGLVDTAFVARLGAPELAALGVGTMVLSSIFWIFNFLGIATQTDVAKAHGKGDSLLRSQISGLAVLVAGSLGLVAALLLWPLTPSIASLLGAGGEIKEAAVSYINIRWFGAPAILITIAGFGALRGVQQMMVPFWIALGVNALNVALDALLIFGFGPIPAFGIEGAAAATSISQWVGAIATVAVLHRSLAVAWTWDVPRVLHLFRAGGDLFIRTGILTLFLVVGTREATRLGAESGAVHQAIRQFWIFTALFLDSFAVAGQSLVGYFLGTDRIALARKVAKTIMQWSFSLGVVLMMVMWFGQGAFAALFVPEAARYAFAGPWLVALIMQPVNALAFGTDGVHWGTADFRFLRNATTTATLIGVTLLYAWSYFAGLSLMAIWIVTSVWIAVRVVFGLTRIWPGSINGPLGRA